MNKKKIAIISFGTASVIVLCLLIYSSCYFYHLGIQRDDPSASFYSHGQRWVENQPYETWSVTSEDGLKLAGYYIPAKVATTKTVLLAHGYLSKGKDMGYYARFYSEELGYNILLPDARGHGASEGDYIGFGWPDRKDYLLWIQMVLERVGNDAQIVLHGLSMGGATVMMVSGEDLPEQVKVIVEDSGYTSVYDQFAYLMNSLSNLPSFPVLTATSMLTKIRAGYNFNEASSVKQLKKNKTPVLFIHGTADTFVPTEMVRLLYAACQAEKEIYLSEGAGHAMAYTANQSTYEAVVKEFVGRFIP